jgi:hypothetical protein
MQDKNFLKNQNLTKANIFVFNKAYNHYLQFANWTLQDANFVSRL